MNICVDGFNHNTLPRIRLAFLFSLRVKIDTSLLKNLRGACTLGVAFAPPPTRGTTVNIPNHLHQIDKIEDLTVSPESTQVAYLRFG